MPNQTDLAKHWGISRQAVSLRVKQGCPVTSIPAADKWWNDRGRKREATNCKFAAGEKPKRKAGRPRSAKGPANTGDSLQDALANAITVADKSFELVEAALLEENDPRLSVRLSIHSKALETRFDAEKSYREEMERRNVLINYNKAAEEFRRGFDFLLTRMKRIPQTQAPRCNPSNPLLALGVLELAINGIIEDAQKEYAA